MKIRVFEAFAGIGTQRMALDRLGIEHDVVAIAEIDKFAIKSYEAIHGKTNNLGDISKIQSEDIPEHDLFTYSFPCQDISIAGKQGGLDEGSGTRSSLLWECNRVIETAKPKYLLMENVKNLVGKRHKPNFDKWLEHLEGLGYTNYWDVLNAKDYGIPQNRQRVFVVSILGEHEPYEFPKPVPLELRLKDVLEGTVDEKYYLSEERVNRLTFNWDKVLANKNLQVVGNTSATEHNSNNIYHENGISPTLTARDYKGPKKVMQVGQYDTNTRTNSNRFRTYSHSGISPSLTTMGGGGLESHVLIGASRGRNPENPSDRTVGSPTEQRLEINKQGTSNTITTVQKDNYVLEGVDVHPFSKKLEFRGYRQKEISPCLLATDYKAPKTILQSQINSSHVQKDNYLTEAKEEFGRMGRQAVEALNENTVEYGDTINPFNKCVSSRNGITPTLTTRPEGFKTAVLPVSEDLRIRNLTPKECWRLMGIDDECFYKAQKVNSNTQLYKQAGNAIVVDVLVAIFKQIKELNE